MVLFRLLVSSVRNLINFSLIFYLYLYCFPRMQQVFPKDLLYIDWPFNWLKWRSTNGLFDGWQFVKEVLVAIRSNRFVNTRPDIILNPSKGISAVHSQTRLIETVHIYWGGGVQCWQRSLPSTCISFFFCITNQIVHQCILYLLYFLFFLLPCGMF